MNYSDNHGLQVLPLCSYLDLASGLRSITKSTHASIVKQPHWRCDKEKREKIPDSKNQSLIEKREQLSLICAIWFVELHHGQYADSHAA